MKRYMLLWAIVLICHSTVGAQNVSAFFIAMPEGVLPHLQDAWRKDLVDLYKAGKEAQLNNTMGGNTRLEKLTDDYLRLQTSSRSRIEIKLLPLINGSQVACVVTTVDAPASDSRVAFYTTDWKELPADELWRRPTLESFVRRDADRQSQAFVHAFGLLDIELIRYNLSPDSPVLTATCTTPDYLNSDERAEVLPFLTNKPLAYEWKNGQFQPVAQP